MRFEPEQAAIRFGSGLSPTVAAPASLDEMLGWLAGPDLAAGRFPIPGIDAVAEHMRTDAKLAKGRRKSKTDAQREEFAEEQKKWRRKIREDSANWLSQALMRRALAQDGFRERLVSFWADHFVAAGKRFASRYAFITYAEDAIRPHVSGKFGDMLRAVATHPLMLYYLDQNTSVGPNSTVGQKKNRPRGLNENLARELLELHTLGVGGPYTQDDVRQLAELLTGLTFDLKTGFQFKPGFAEPGAETVMSISYGGKKARLEDIYAALDDLAKHPITAQHIAQKLAVHFVSDTPDPEMVARAAARYSETDGDLLSVYEALLTHPYAWRPAGGNVKRPIDFIGSSLRALNLRPEQMPSDNFGRMRSLFLTPMTLMGQAWGQPEGPDGWAEADTDWITPQRLSARTQWAISVPFRVHRNLPDPREFVEVALGSRVTEAVLFAARAAETRPEGVGLILASPAFQRM